VRGHSTFELLVVGGGGRNGSFQLQLGTGGASPAVDVTLTRTCTRGGHDPTIKFFEVEGGCVTYRSGLPAGAGAIPSFDPRGGLSFIPRSQLVAFVNQDEDLILCGACP